jgi:cytochrome c550
MLMNQPHAAIKLLTLSSVVYRRLRSFIAGIGRRIVMRHSLHVLVIVLIPLLLFACGQSQPSSAEPTKDLLAATPLTTHVFKQPTTIIKEVAAEKAETPEASAEDLSRGERSYTSKKCGDCHGAKGEGVDGKGKALAGTSLTEEEFTDLLRTGGGLGNSHLYGTQAISPSGMEALYAFVKSFQP